MGQTVNLLVLYLRWFESIFAHKNIAAVIAQLVEHDLAKVGVASSSLVYRSTSHGALVQSG